MSEVLFHLIMFSLTYSVFVKFIPKCFISFETSINYDCRSKLKIIIYTYSNCKTVMVDLKFLKMIYMYVNIHIYLYVCLCVFVFMHVYAILYMWRLVDNLGEPGIERFF